MFRLKFFHYPNYRQTVQTETPPAGCKLRSKGNNAFFLFQRRTHGREIVSLERVVEVFPIISKINPKDDWGIISEISKDLQRKYKESSRFWPVKWASDSSLIEQEWFRTDDLSLWTREAYRFVRKSIKRPERQEKRHGAEEAYLTGIGDCDEFTDLLVTLARMRGIPCRRLTGFFIHWKDAKAEVRAEPHAWAEILSPKAGWIITDVAMNNIGIHSVNYVILKIEEFNPALPDYQVRANFNALKYQLERPEPTITQIL